MVFDRAFFLSSQLPCFCVKNSNSLRENTFLSQELHGNEQKYMSIVKKYGVVDKLAKIDVFYA